MAQKERMKTHLYRCVIFRAYSKLLHDAYTRYIRLDAAYDLSRYIAIKEIYLTTSPIIQRHG